MCISAFDLTFLNVIMVVKMVRLSLKDRQMCSKRHKGEALEGPAFQTGCKMWPNLFVRHAECTNLIILYNPVVFQKIFHGFLRSAVTAADLQRRACRKGLARSSGERVNLCHPPANCNGSSFLAFQPIPMITKTLTEHILGPSLPGSRKEFCVS
jgi:hypothetical protein